MFRKTFCLLLLALLVVVGCKRGAEQPKGEPAAQKPQAVPERIIPPEVPPESLPQYAPDLPPWKQTKQFGGRGEDLGYGIAVNKAGNIYVGGKMEDDALLVALSPSGEIPWSKESKIAGAPDEIRSIAVDEYGNIYIAGDVRWSTPDAFLSKYNSSGTLLWERTVDSGKNDFLYGVAVSPDGKSVNAAGFTSGTYVEANRGGYDVIVTQFSSDGVQNWKKQFGTPGNDYAMTLAVDDKGNIYVGGFTYGGMDGNVSAGLYDVFVARFDQRGNKVGKIKQMGTAYDDFAHGVVPFGKDVYVAGTTRGNFGGPNKGGADIFVAKYGPEGTWTKQIGTEEEDKAYGMAVDGEGNAFVAGWSYGVLNCRTEDNNLNEGLSDIILAKYGSDGKCRWAREIGTAEDDITYSVAVDGRGNMYATGYTAGGLDGNKNFGDKDVFVIKFNTKGEKQ